MEETESNSPRVPAWYPFVLGTQFLIAIILLGLSAYIIHGKYFNTLGFVIFVSLLTWLVVVFNFATVYVASLKQYRISYLSLGIDAVMFLFWLSAMGSAAALRASFKYSVTIQGCYNDGSLVNSSTCIVERDLSKRAAVATETGLSIMSAIAGISAIEMLLYLGCLIYGIIGWNKSRTSSTAAETTAYKPQIQTEGYQMETQQQAYHGSQPVMQQQTYSQQTYPQDTTYQQPHTQAPAGYQPNMPNY